MRRNRAPSISRLPQRLGLALLVAASLGALGCVRERAPRILFMPGVLDAFYLTLEEGARAAAARLGAEFAVAEYPEIWGPDYQIPILKAAIEKGDWDVLLIAPTSTEALIAPLKAIHEAGIVVVTVDTFLGDGDYGKQSGYSFPLAYIGSDNFVGGRLMAERLAKLVGERGRVFCQATNPDTSSIQDRVDGFVSGIAEFPNMELVATEWCRDIQALAEAQTLGALMEHRDIVGVFGVNVFSAQGSYLAVVDAGLEGAVKICSWDATEDLIMALEAGQVDLVLAQKPAEMGALAVERSLEFLADPAGARIPRRILTGFEFFTRETVDDPALSAYVYR